MFKNCFVNHKKNNNLYNSHSKTNPFETTHLIHAVLTQKLFKLSRECVQSPTIHSLFYYQAYHNLYHYKLKKDI